MTDRRAAAAERLHSLKVFASVFTEAEEERLLGDVPGEARAVLSAPRFRSRLVARAAAQLAISSRVAVELGRDAVFKGLPDAATEIALRAGAIWHGRELLMLLDGTAISAFERELGVDPRETALHAEQAGFDFPEHSSATALTSPERLLVDGALCWAAWISRRSPAEGRAFAFMTPRSVRRRVDRTKLRRGIERARVTEWAVTDWISGGANAHG